jgi:hypothetical protein
MAELIGKSVLIILIVAALVYSANILDLTIQKWLQKVIKIHKNKSGLSN